ncbi:MAG TPA: hypothetical protein VKY31_01100 [Terriglobia bacterium]|nr:hypothetical protein [Terriglobia bacterium]
MKSALNAAGIVLLVLATQWTSSALLTTHAQSKPSRHCVWTYIHDVGEPNIGEDGQVDFSKGPNWKRVSDEGWELKAVKTNGDSYIFEKCE